jgi:glycosyltransferase involved in cell wall biosynthesis
MNNVPLVSIGVPTCNRAHLLEQALRTLLSQDYPHLEILISDNASTDETPALCKRLANQYPFIHYQRQPEKVRATVNFTSVLLRARGEFFMWAADDDLWEPAFVSTLVRRHEANPHLALAMCETQYRLANGTRLPFFAEGGFWHNPPKMSAAERLTAVARHNYGDLIYGLYRRAILLKPYGTVLDTWKYLNEIPIFLHVAAQGEIAVCNEVLFLKTIPLNTYLYAAREYEFFPSAKQLRDLKAPVISENLIRNLYRRLRTAFKIPKGAIHHFRYHFHTWKDICGTIDALKLEPSADRALRRTFAWRLASHYLKTVVVWNFQDIFLPRPYR